jgi:hypothetical protein
MLPLFGQSVFVLFFLAHKIDCCFYGIAPIGLRVSLDGDVVCWAMLQIPSLVDRHGVPGKEFGQKLNVFQHLFVDG